MRSRWDSTCSCEWHWLVRMLHQRGAGLVRRLPGGSRAGLAL